MRVAAAVTGVVVALAAVAVVVVLAGSRDTPPSVERGIPVRTVLDGPERFLGRSLTVTGPADVVTDRAMTIGERDLIVVAADPRTQNFAAGGLGNGDRVHATGTLELLDAEQAVKRLPGPSLLPSQFQGFERQPVLIARRVIRAQ